MQTTSIHAMLDLPAESPLLLTDVQLSGWGRALMFTGLAGDQPFTLTFEECRDVRWRIYAHLDVNEPTPLIEFAAGRDQHRSPAQLLTGHFGLSIFYGTLRVERKEKIASPGADAPPSP